MDLGDSKYGITQVMNNTNQGDTVMMQGTAGSQFNTTAALLNNQSAMSTMRRKRDVENIMEQTITDFKRNNETLITQANEDQIMQLFVKG